MEKKTPTLETMKERHTHTHTLPLPHHPSMIHCISCLSCSWGTGTVQYLLFINSTCFTPLFPMFFFSMILPQYSSTILFLLPSLPPSLPSFIPSAANALLVHMKAYISYRIYLNQKASRGFYRKRGNFDLNITYHGQCNIV